MFSNFSVTLDLWLRRLMITVKKIQIYVIPVFSIVFG